MSLDADTGTAGGGGTGARSTSPDGEVAAAVAQVRAWLPFARVAALAEAAAAIYLTWPVLLLLADFWTFGLGFECALMGAPGLAAVLMFAGSRRVLTGLRGAPARIPRGLRLYGLGALLIGVPVVLAFGISTAQMVLGGRRGGFSMRPEEFLLTAGLTVPLPVAVWGAVLHYRHRAALGAAP